ncbi:uncharacterized protein LOC113645605 [Tachysurus fulvidraco]|uniref:uncharacterized protein LOC113645605 n=1 Tax=Tachysurus fulvidraco TaxID=1234273 RepID=UPI001FEDEBCA|nr:uncharacterized protein LOC113645605 [Tachysurus fulvidraco]
MVASGDSLVHVLCTAHTLENCVKSADQGVSYCVTFNQSVVKLLQFYLFRGGAKNIQVLKTLCHENGISYCKLGKFHNIKWSAWRHETLLKIWKQLPAIKTESSNTDDSDLKYICTQRFQCFLANMLDTGNILQLTSQRFQQEKLTIGECKDELMLAIGQFTILLDGEGQHRKQAVHNSEADRDKAELLRGLIDCLATHARCRSASTLPNPSLQYRKQKSDSFRSLLMDFSASINAPVKSAEDGRRPAVHIITRPT